MWTTEQFRPRPTPGPAQTLCTFLWIGERLAGISPVGHTSPGVDRQILALAVPALGALVAEPLFVLVDSAVVGHLGTAPLAGLALASTILITVIGLCVFLAYATTAAVARRLGSGDRTGALQLGVDGMWLALGLGVVLAVATWLTAPWLVDALGATDEVATQAVTYLRWSAPGLPGMLLVLASTGALRGLLDTRTPLVVASIGAVVNAILNIVLVYGVGMGIAGSGLGTAITQVAMGIALSIVVVRGARRVGAALRPAVGGILANARAGVPLFVRTLSLRLAILLTVVVATSLGPVPLAAHQVVGAVWGLAAFALDALAIAAQALVGHALGASDVALVRALLRRSLQWGVGAGAVLGARARRAGLALRAAVHAVGRRAAGRGRCTRRRRADDAHGRLDVRARRRAHRRRRRPLPRVGRHRHARRLRALRAGRPARVPRRAPRPVWPGSGPRSRASSCWPEP